ncbi:phosphonate ABC transporter permease [Enterococcus florum]|uniref:Phosphonate ABC transporter permease n=1 Tax=Enterococcus florum TaxID=2480627 RepID=A0A4P5P4Y9_9ENTE|nr:ABC transporter permease subunit [Enterococcus florum]GCF92740.1 phosphonate ABC transporter permease [Enterococcus florum]
MKNKLSLKQLTNWVVLFFFLLFLAIPLIKIGLTAFPFAQGGDFAQFSQIFNQKWQTAFSNSLWYAVLAASISTILAFLLAYGNNFTKIGQPFLMINSSILQFPMLLPTITYGFVLIYAFGKQGLWSKLFQHQLFNIYGSIGILMGFIIYTLPPIFILINNAMKYLDARLFLVSRLMGDSPARTLKKTIFEPLYRVLAVAFLQGFFMAFTDFGVPSAVGGQTPFITTLLYEGFMGTIPDFQYGAMIAITMLLPSIISIIVLNHLQKKIVRYEKPQRVVLKTNKLRDWGFRLLFLTTSGFLLCIFLILVVIPFTTEWPYRIQPTLVHLTRFLEDDSLRLTLRNSLTMAVSTAVIGTVLAYFAAILTSRERKTGRLHNIIDSISTVTNSIPGMVLGVAFLLLFGGSILHNTLAILIISTVVHYFATPYQLAKEALQKMNLNWENTAKLMGDRWIDTIRRILIPNSKLTILEMFGYYFFNAMITISAVIFLTSANTMVITAKLKELQHFGRFNDIFMLSLFLLMINLIMQGIIQLLKRSLTNHEQKTSFRLSLLHLVRPLLRRLQQR